MVTVRDKDRRRDKINYKDVLYVTGNMVNI